MPNDKTCPILPIWLDLAGMVDAARIQFSGHRVSREQEMTVNGRANSMTGMPHLAVTPPAITQRQSADWGLVQPEQVDVIRHESFDYQFKGSRHLLIASERAERLDGETLLDGLPKSNCREWNRKMTFVPAGHRFYGWQKPRSLLRSTFLYIDPLSSLLSELRFAESTSGQDCSFSILIFGQPP